MGRGSRRRARPLRGRSGRRRDASARGRGGAEADAADRAAPARRRRAGRLRARPRARLAQRPLQRTRHGLALGDLCVPRLGDRLPDRSRGRGRAPEARGLVRLRLVGVGRRPWTHYAAPAAFLLAVSIAVLVVRSGLDTTAPPKTVAPPLRTAPTTTVT